MNEKKQAIRTVLIPESGLVLEPQHSRESFVGTDFSRVLAHLIGKTSSGGILIKATSGGSLHVVTAGVPFEIYAVNNGTAADAYNAGDTFEFATAFNVTDILVEIFAATISFRNEAGVWLGNKALPVGFHSIDFINYGIRIRNRTGGSNSVYEFTSYQ
ncbi:hypothetical protein LCGC14_1377400 [marine sediment metagenome]|uniref:Uncharacterized protein n=1 Tax=marine sediment metagenome TaxID=412755 RepID=A0A0F9KPK3_9ZZZZ